MSKVKQLNINGTTYDLDTKVSNLYNDTTIRNLHADEFFSEQYLGAWSIWRSQVSYFSNMPVQHSGILYVLYPDSDDGLLTLIYIDGEDKAIYLEKGYQAGWYGWTRVDAGGVDTSDKVSKSGDTMTGNLTINNDSGATISLTNSNGYPASSLSNTQLSINGDTSYANLYIASSDIPTFNMASANANGQVDMTANEIKVGKAGEATTYYSKLTYGNVTVNGQNSRNANLTPKKLSIIYDGDGQYAWLNASSDPHVQLEYQGQGSKLTQWTLELNGSSDSNDGFTTGSGKIQLRADQNKPYVLVHQVGNASNYAKLGCDYLSMASDSNMWSLDIQEDSNTYPEINIATGASGNMKLSYKELTFSDGGNNAKITVGSGGTGDYGTSTLTCNSLNISANSYNYASITPTVISIDSYGETVSSLYNDRLHFYTYTGSADTYDIDIYPTKSNGVCDLYLKDTYGTTKTYRLAKASELPTTFATIGIEVGYELDGDNRCDWSSLISVSNSIPSVIRVRDDDFDSYTNGTVCHLDYYYAESGYFAYSAIVDGPHTYSSSAYSTTPVIVTYYNDNMYSADNIIRKITPIGTGGVSEIPVVSDSEFTSVFTYTHNENDNTNTYTGPAQFKFSEHYPECTFTVSSIDDGQQPNIFLSTNDAPASGYTIYLICDGGSYTWYEC